MACVFAEYSDMVYGTSVSGSYLQVLPLLQKCLQHPDPGARAAYLRSSQSLTGL